MIASEMTASEMGKKGMAARLKKMTKEQRVEQARIGGKARWVGVSEEERKAYGRKIRKAKSRKKKKK